MLLPTTLKNIIISGLTLKNLLCDEIFDKNLNNYLNVKWTHFLKRWAFIFFIFFNTNNWIYTTLYWIIFFLRLFQKWTFGEENSSIILNINIYIDKKKNLVVFELHTTYTNYNWFIISICIQIVCMTKRKSLWTINVNYVWTC